MDVDSKMEMVNSSKTAWHLNSNWQEWNQKRIEDSTWSMPLNKLHPHPRDRYLAFDEGPHKYYLFGKQYSCPSVSSVSGHFFPKFDNQLVAKRIVASHDYKLGRGKYPGMDVDSIIALWEANGKAASERGTQLHSEVEWYLNYGKARVSAEALPEFQQFLSLYATEILAENLVPYRTEWRVYGSPYLSKEGKEEVKEEVKEGKGNVYMPGTIDALFIQKGSEAPARDVPLELELWDWKDSLKVNPDEIPRGKGLGPLSQVPHTTFHHYSVNLNLYKWILERHYNVKVSKMVLGVVHPSFEDQGGYKVYRVPEMAHETVQVVEAWWKHLDETTSWQE